MKNCYKVAKVAVFVNLCTYMFDLVIKPYYSYINI